MSFFNCDEVALKEIIKAAVREVLAEQGGKASVEYLSVADAARVASVTPASIRAWIGAGRLKRYNAGRELRVRRDELDALLAADKPERPEPPSEPVGPPSPEQEAARVIAMSAHRREKHA